MSGGHGRSIKNPATYEALRRKFGKTKAARISNAALKKGYRKGVHGRSRSGRKRRM